MLFFYLNLGPIILRDLKHFGLQSPQKIIILARTLHVRVMWYYLAQIIEKNGLDCEGQKKQ